jgi:hypothetical protein
VHAQRFHSLPQFRDMLLDLGAGKPGVQPPKAADMVTVLRSPRATKAHSLQVVSALLSPGALAVDMSGDLASECLRVAVSTADMTLVTRVVDNLQLRRVMPDIPSTEAALALASRSGATGGAAVSGVVFAP